MRAVSLSKSLDKPIRRIQTGFLNLDGVDLDGGDGSLVDGLEGIYLRPDGTSMFLRPDGTSIFTRPGGSGL